MRVDDSFCKRSYCVVPVYRSQCPNSETGIAIVLSFLFECR